jgi:hypothetical protein
MGSKLQRRDRAASASRTGHRYGPSPQRCDADAALIAAQRRNRRRYLTFARIPFISLFENALSVCVRTLPAEPVDNMKAVADASSGASMTMTRSKLPTVQ